MTRLLERPLFWAILIGVLAVVVYAVSFADPTPYNHYVLLADAFLRGRVDIPDSPIYLEMTMFRGRHYVIPPPGPALLLLPYVAVSGVRANQSLVSYLIGGLAAALTVLVAARLFPRRRDYLWLGVLGAFGTILWFMSAVGSTWYFAHVVAVAALTLAVLETVGARQHPIIIGLGIGFAYLSHLPTVLTLPYFLVATRSQWAPGGLREWRRIRFEYLIRLTAPIAYAVGFNSAYNWIRFGTVADVANAVRPGIFSEPWFSRGLFSPSYIPRHLQIVLREVPRIIAQPPYVPVPWTGLAIWVTTPAFVYALRAPATLETLGAWLGIIGVSLVVMSFGATGISQFGYRLATDFYPLLFLLTAWGMRGRMSTLAKVLIVLSVIVNAWGVIFTRLGWVAQ